MRVAVIHRTMDAYPSETVGSAKKVDSPALPPLHVVDGQTAVEDLGWAARVARFFAPVHVGMASLRSDRRNPASGTAGAFAIGRGWVWAITSPLPPDHLHRGLRWCDCRPNAVANSSVDYALFILAA